MKRRKKGKEMSEEKAKNQPEEELKQQLQDEANEDKELKVEDEKEVFKSRIAELEKEKREATDRYLRTLAEFENFRRRSAKERIDWIKNANESLILKLCDVMDDFERAFQNLPDNMAKDGFVSGIEAIQRKFLNLLKGEGLEKIAAEESEFDPMYHEAIAYTPSDKEKDKIVSVIQNGYIMNNKIIRPARVAVSAGMPEESEAEDNN